MGRAAPVVAAGSQRLDLFHVLERLWQVAHVFTAKEVPRLSSSSHTICGYCLKGKVGYVIGHFKRLRNERATLRLAAAHPCWWQSATTKQPPHCATTNIWPLATHAGGGLAAEGVQHVVKDRLERTGMRWTINGTQAMLHLRAVYLGGRLQPVLNSLETAPTPRLYWAFCGVACRATPKSILVMAMSAGVARRSSTKISRQPLCPPVIQTFSTDAAATLAPLRRNVVDIDRAGHR